MENAEHVSRAHPFLPHLPDPLISSPTQVFPVTHGSAHAPAPQGFSNILRTELGASLLWRKRVKSIIMCSTLG